MKALEPGDLFTIEYGNGHTLQVRALNGRQKRKIAAALHRLRQFDPDKQSPEDVYEIAEEMLRLAIGAKADELLETTDEQQQIQIASNVLAGAALSDDEKKGSASLHSSAAEPSVKAAEVPAGETWEETLQPKLRVPNATSLDVRNATEPVTST